MTLYTGSDIALVLTGLGTLVAAVAAAVVSIKTSLRVDEVKQETLAQTVKLDNVHKVVEQVQVESNGMKDELIREVRAASLAQGRKDADDEAGRPSKGSET